MRIQAEISIYALKTESLSEAIEEFCETAEASGVEITGKKMSTLIAGESEVLFEAVKMGFEKIAERYKVVMDAKFSNACPE